MRAIGAVRLPDVVVAGIAGVALMLLVGGLAGQDYNWDLLNYHYASVQLLLSGRYDLNIAPSQVQSWFNPIAYIPAYLAITYLPPWVASALFAIVGGLNAPLIYLIADRIGGDLPERVRVRSGFVCVAIGMSGAVLFSEAGTTFLDDMLSIPILATVLATISGMRAADPTRRACCFAIAGLLMGAACGLKLTNLVMAVGMAGAITVLVLARRVSLFSWLAFALGGLVGFLLTGGWWALRMWETFGNPVFPMFNGLFQSRFAPPRSQIDTTFLPSDWAALFTFPWHWLVGDAMPGIEIAVVDRRYGVALIASAVIGLVVLARRGRIDRRHDEALLIALFCLLTYAVWLFSFAILRYVLVFEMLSGVILLAALSLLPTNRVRHVPTIMILAAFAMTLGTRYGNWGRAPFSDDWFDVRGVEQVVRPGTTYILPGAAPLGFLIHIFPADARFIGIGGTFPLTPDDVLGARTVQMIRAAPHLRSLAAAPTDPASIAALHRFGLTIIQNSCRVIRTKRADVESCALSREAGRAYGRNSKVSL
ncbi:MAG: hypothetical protein ABI810_10505 [Sphingomonas bacterium]